MERLAQAIATVVSLFFLSQVVVAQTTQAERPATVLVLDVSNSMWGQIEGVSKIEIAREVIGELLSDWNPDVELGLVAYGHRRESDCSDIESVIPVGSVDPAAFSAVVNSLVPRGRTPLTKAVRVAAQTLSYTDRPATVILVSDGIESCEADPCALALELENSGIDFTAHVVGFDVARIADQGQLSCLADITGGRYLTAKNAGELSAALRTVSAPPPPAAPMLSLEAADSADGPALSDPSIRWTIVQLDTEANLMDSEAMAMPAFETEAGRYFARAELGNRLGSVEFDYSAEADALMRIVLLPVPSLQGPEFAEVGKEFQVQWTGPNSSGDYIAVARPETAASTFESYARTSGGSPAKFTAPLTTGLYQLRYVDASSTTVLASVELDVIAPAANLDGPTNVYTGANFDVAWTGPDVKGDYISIVSVGSEDRTIGNYAYTRGGSPANLRAPDTVGPHELRYISAQTKGVIARQLIEVLPYPATLEAAPVVPGSEERGVGTEGPQTWR
jgi:Ca-activated chloride channel family protein